MSSLILSEKYKKFLKCGAEVEFLEGTTAAGKTTVGIVKFILKCAGSKKKLHILSGLDTGVIEKNIINKDLGVLDIFGEYVSYNPSGRGEHSLPHLRLKNGNSEKIIYVLGYDNKARWKKVLGGQYGCVYVDEINIADMEYVREISIRCDYFLATLNPDDPSLPIYSEYINHARPLACYRDDAPKELLSLLSKTPKNNWVWWYFSFEHNKGLSKERIEKIINAVPPGTKLYKNKVQGLRGRATGVVFSNFETKRHVITPEQAHQMHFIIFSVGIDTAYSSRSEDTISMIFQGITDDGTLVVLDERVYNNRDLHTPIAPSDTVQNLIDFLNRNQEAWGLARNVFIDSADQATITELHKYKRNNPCVYVFNPAYKQMKIVDRINTQLGWFHRDKYLVVNTCKNHIRELENYSWNEKKDNEPEDACDHTINASQYGFLPYVKKIGG